MYVKLGSHQFADNTVTISNLRKRRKRNRRGGVDRVIETMNLEGVLIASSQSALKTAILDFEAAMQDGRDVALFHDDNAKSAHFLNNSSSISGVRLVAFDYPKNDGSEYATQRSFTITLEAEYPGNNDGLISFEESLVFLGTGGPKRILIETLTGIQEQITKRRTIQRIIQAGSAMGRNAFPKFPNPLFPRDEAEDRRSIRHAGPTFDGNQYTNYGVNWVYHYETARAVFGNPNFR